MIVIIITGLAQAFGGIQMSITIIGFAMIAAAVWAWFTPDNLEQADTTPDNVPMSQLVPRLMALGFAQKRKLAGVLGDGMFAFVILAISLTLTGSFSLAYILFVILAFAGAWMIYIINDKEFAD